MEYQVLGEVSNRSAQVYVVLQHPSRLPRSFKLISTGCCLAGRNALRCRKSLSSNLRTLMPMEEFEHKLRVHNKRTSSFSSLNGGGFFQLVVL